MISNLGTESNLNQIKTYKSPPAHIHHKRLGVFFLELGTRLDLTTLMRLLNTKPGSDLFLTKMKSIQIRGKNLPLLAGSLFAGNVICKKRDEEGQEKVSVRVQDTKSH